MKQNQKVCSGEPRSPRAFLPLTSVAFEILVSLVGEARHGYALLGEIEERTAGALSLRPGTLYRALGRLLDEGLVRDSDAPSAKVSAAEPSGLNPRGRKPGQPKPIALGPSAPRDERRRRFELTELGHTVVVAESERLAASIEWARGKRLLRPER